MFKVSDHPIHFEHSDNRGWYQYFLYMEIIDKRDHHQAYMMQSSDFYNNVEDRIKYRHWSRTVYHDWLWIELVHYYVKTRVE